MWRYRVRGSVVLLVGTMVAAGAVDAATRTYVSLAGRDGAVPKLGLPGIALRVENSGADEAGVLTEELARELARQVHTRPLAAGEPGDYDLQVIVGTPSQDASTTVLLFEASLTSARGEKLWRIEGRTVVEDAPLDPSVFAGIGRNVVSALIHDGWVVPRYDPNDPPPQPPTIRMENGR